MPQPTASPAAPSTPATTPPSANITRSDGVVGTSAPTAAAPGGTLQPAGTAAPAVQQQGGGSMLLIMALPLAVLMLFMFMGNRKENKRRAEHAATLSNLQRNDKVQTIGGMIGNVAEMTDTEVVLRVDEITNTRVRVSRSAITAVLNRNVKPDGVKAGA